VLAIDGHRGYLLIDLPQSARHVTDILSSGSVVALGRDTFGPWLRAERERRGIALTTIAEQTKIKRSLLESLERGDLSHWPTASIYRRAHMRDYAAVIGLPSDPVVAQFVRLFPGPEDAVESSGQDMLDSLEASRLTMTLVVGGMDRFRLQAERARVAALDVVVLGVAAALVAWLLGASWLACVGVLAVCYFAAGTVALGETPGAWAVKRVSRRVGRLRSEAAERVEASAPSVPTSRRSPAAEVPFPVLMSESASGADLTRETSIH
jgi:transcriptional regulator with XRE-family HTH domain